MVKIILILLFPIGGWAQVLESPETKNQQAGALVPKRVSGEIKLDGKLDEEAWTAADPLTDFMQALPKIGASPTERTVLKITYDDDFLYVGIRAYDSFPSKIIATGLERDVYYSSDDNLCVLIDTYNDKRQGVLFSTNPLSARFDEEVLTNGDDFNSAYNTFWNVRSLRDELGYTAEFQIPFSSLRFQPAAEVVMGIKIIRYVKHKNEYQIFPASDASLNNLVWRVNNAQEIIFTSLRARKPFYIIPYGKINYEQTKDISPDGSEILTNSSFLKGNHFSSHTGMDRVISNIGVDVKYGLSKNFTLDATFNTDFAQAEADNRIFNFTRFGINLPEKRNFFLESKDYLGFTSGANVLLFNSRTIGIENGNVVPILGGVRVTGKSNGLQLGFLDLQTKGVEEATIDPQHFTVLRIRREVMGNGSFIGGIITNRISTRGTAFNNQTIGVDVVKRFKDNKWIAAANLSSTNDQAYGGFLHQSSMVDLMITRVATLGYNHTSYLDFAEKNFKPLSGFAPDSAFAQVNTTNKYVWKWKQNKQANLYWISNQTTYKYRTINKTHELLLSELEVGTSFKNGAIVLVTPSVSREFIPYLWNFIEGISIPVAYYINKGIRVQYDSKQTGQLNYSATGRLSDFYGGQRFNFLLKGYYAINKNFRFTYNYEFNAFKFPETYTSTGVPSYRTNLVYSGLAYTRSIYFSVKMLIQYDDISKTIGGNFRIRINPKEGTDLFIVYNPRLNTVFAPLSDKYSSTRIDRQTLIIKFSKALSL